MIPFEENVWHSSLYLDTKGEIKFVKSSERFSLTTRGDLVGD